jgi:uncharacterized protein
VPRRSPASATCQLLLVHSSGPQGPRQGSRYLAAALRKALGPGYDLRYPVMPAPDDPAYAPWRDRLQAELDTLDGDALIVGHSLGGSVLLKCLSESRKARPIPAVFLLATPFWSAPAGSQLHQFVLRRGFAARLPPIGQIFLYHSRDDDSVPFTHLARYAQALPQATVRELDGYGHLFKRTCKDLVADIRARARSS